MERNAISDGDLEAIFRERRAIVFRDAYRSPALPD